MSAFPSPLPPCETQEGGFSLCHFSFETFIHCPKPPLQTALGVPCHSSQWGHTKPNEPCTVGGRCWTGARAISCVGRKWMASEQSAQMRSETIGCCVRITFQVSECPHLACRTRITSGFACRCTDTKCLTAISYVAKTFDSASVFIYQV